jgi:hypothetical protein
MATPALNTAHKIPAVVRSKFTNELKLMFPAGGITNQKPIINLLLTDYPATERIDSYFDIGPTDVAGDMDIVTSAVMKSLYLDPAYLDTAGTAMTGVLPPKAVMLRCLLGSGLVYLNCPPVLVAGMNMNAPLQLHANAGLFYYAFPRATAHYAAATDLGALPQKLMLGLSLLSIYLRTFEDANRFQLVIFK